MMKLDIFFSGLVLIMGVDTELVKTHVRPRCFMDVAVDNIILGRIVFELFDDFCPLT